MAESEWFRQDKKHNNHDDIVLRKPTLSSGETILAAGFKSPINSFNNIMGIVYPEYRREIHNLI